MKIISGKKIKPVALLIYGIHGIGKTTLPSEAQKPIYIGSEENDEFDIDRMPKVETWKDLESQLTWLMDNDHDYKTLVIDTMDALEQVAQKEILKGQNGKTMATAFGGYGKAYEKMSDMFLDIRDDYLVKLRDIKGMNIVILCHAEKSKHEDPMTGTSYDHYSTSLHKKNKPIFEDWVSAILFVTWELFKTESSDGKERAIGDGTRLIYTEERPSHVAKNRFGLPYTIDFDKEGSWKKISGYIKEYYGNSPKFDSKREDKGDNGINPELEQIKIAINELMGKIDEETREKIALSLARAKDDIKEVTRIHKKLEKLVK